VEGGGGCIPEEDVDLLPPPPQDQEDGSRLLLHPPKPAPRKGPSQEVQVGPHWGASIGICLTSKRMKKLFVYMAKKEELSVRNARK